MFWALAVILVAVAGFSVLVVRLRQAGGQQSPGIDLEQLRGFVFVGAAAMCALAVTVVVIGLVRPDQGIAESVAVLGFLAYGAYLATAGVIIVAMARRP